MEHGKTFIPEKELENGSVLSLRFDKLPRKMQWLTVVYVLVLTVGWNQDSMDQKDTKNSKSKTKMTEGKRIQRENQEDVLVSISLLL